MRSEIRYLSMLKGGTKKPFEVFLDPIPHIVKKGNSVAIRGWYKSKFEPKGTRNRPCYAEAILTTPYVGFCPGNCAFCYVNNGTRGWRSTGVMVVDPNYPESVRKQISKLYIASPFYMSSFTEPFNKLEDVYHIVEQVSQIAIDNNIPIFYCTRQKLPKWAIENLKKNPYSYVQWSINMVNENDWRLISPGAEPLPTLLQHIKEVGEQGIYTTWQVNPLLYGITTKEDLIQLVHKAKELGVKHLIFKFVEIVFNSKENLVEVLRRRLKDDVRVNRFESHFEQNIGGVRTVKEHIRKEVLDMLKKEVEGLGLTMGLCYEYEKHFQHPAGVSLGPKYQTKGYQCHGRPIPMFYRDNLNDKFKPLEGCNGICLYCNEEGSKVCNNEILLQAKALKYPDMRKIQIGKETPKCQKSNSLW